LAQKKEEPINGSSIKREDLGQADTEGNLSSCLQCESSSGSSGDILIS